MKVQNEARNLLQWIYDHYIESGIPEYEKVRVACLHLTREQLCKVLLYMDRVGYISCNEYFNNEIHIQKLLPKGIDYIERDEQYEN